jgi:MFS family permease
VHRSFGVSSIYAFSVPTMMADSGLPDAQFSATYGAATLAGAVFQFRWGRLIDRYGARLALPGFLCLLGAGLTGMTLCGPELGWGNFPLLFVSWTCMRTTAIGALDNCTNTAVAQWFDKRRGRAMSLMNFAAQLLQGGAYAQIAQRSVAERGWRFTNRYVAGLGCAVLALVCAMLVWHTPEEVGCAPDGARKPAAHSVYAPNTDEESEGAEDDTDDEQSLLSGEKDMSDTPEQRAPASSAQCRDYTVKEARANASLYLLAGTVGSFGFVWASTDFYLLAIVASNTGTAVLPDLASTYYFPQAMGACTFTIIAGVLVDRGLGPHIILSFAAACCAIQVVLLTQTGRYLWVNVAAGVLRGVVLSGYGTVSGVVWAQYYGRTNIGAIASHAQIAMVVYSAAGPVVFGLAFAALGDYTQVLLGTALLPATMGVLDLFLLRPPPRLG